MSGYAGSGCLSSPEIEKHQLCTYSLI